MPVFCSSSNYELYGITVEYATIQSSMVSCNFTSRYETIIDHHHWLRKQLSTPWPAATPDASSTETVCVAATYPTPAETTNITTIAIALPDDTEIICLYVIIAVLFVALCTISAIVCSMWADKCGGRQANHVVKYVTIKPV